MTSAGPLEGMVVADFSRVLAGPLATVWLADLGATVIKVEMPGTGDDTWRWGPPWTEESSTYFQSANRTKQSVELDLAVPDDHRLALRLARRADVLVENFRVGALTAKGLGYEDVAVINPGIVYCSISGFGSGAGASLPGYDFLVQAVGGLMSVTGEPGGEPTKVGVALVDVLTAKDATIGILAALRARDATGLGQHVEANLLSSLLGALVNQASAYLWTGIAPRRMGSQHPSIAPYETLQCSDGQIAVACGNDTQFARLADALGVPHIAADERFSTNPLRVLNRTSLVAELERVLVLERASDWVVRLTERGVPAGQVGDIADAFTLAQSLGLDPRVPVGAGWPDQVRHPVTYSATPVTRYGRPPRLGEHNDAVRGWLSEEEDQQ